jgi:hypothetical protein
MNQQMQEFKVMEEQSIRMLQQIQQSKPVPANDPSDPKLVVDVEGRKYTVGKNNLLSISKPMHK